MGGGAAIGHAQRPLDRLKIHLTNVGVLPGFFRMSERRVEHSPFSVHLAPGNRKIMVHPMDPRIVRVIQPAGVEAKQNIHIVARPVLRLINLVVLYKLFRKMADCGKVRGLIDDRRIECPPGMLVEVSANHLSILRPGIVRIQSRMNSNKPFPVVLDEGKHVQFLARIEIQFARRTRKDQDIEIVQVLRIPAQVFFCNQLSIGADHRVPNPALMTHVVDRGQCRGD